MSFRQNVRWRRRQLGITQEELASRVRLRRRRTTASYICRIERGQLDPPVSFVYSLARALRVRPWFLLADIQDATAWLDAYLSLSPAQKRAVQQYIKGLHERRW